MMRGLFIVSTLLFWLMVIGFAAANFWLATEQDGTPAVSADRGYTLQEIARHNRQDDCWMAIGNEVYDFTVYLPAHPADPAIFLPWCGQEATQAFRTKTLGRPHSGFAEQLLPKYRIGKLK